MAAFTEGSPFAKSALPRHCSPSSPFFGSVFPDCLPQSLPLLAAAVPAGAQKEEPVRGGRGRDQHDHRGIRQEGESDGGHSPRYPIPRIMDAF